MTCQHILFESDRAGLPAAGETGFEFRFQPIVDTFEHRILAHECFVLQCGVPAGAAGGSFEAAWLRSRVVHSAARQSRHGLYFLNLVPASVDDPDRDMASTIEAIFDARMHPGNVVFDVAESDLARDPAHSRRIRDYLHRNGFGFSLSGAGVGAGASSFEAVSEFAPDYIKLDRRLARNIDQPASAPAISKLVRMAESSGARLVAEGVDRGAMVENLWLLGVQFMQGHLFGDPANHAIRAAKLEFAP